MRIVGWILIFLGVLCNFAVLAWNLYAYFGLGQVEATPAHEFWWDVWWYRLIPGSIAAGTGYVTLGSFR